MIERDGRHQLSLPFFSQLPASHVMTARDDARTNSFRHPRADDEVANLCFDSDEIARSHIDAHGMKGMNPERIRVRDFVEPFGISAPCMNLHGQAKGRDENG